MKRGVACPTLSLSLEIKKDPKDAKWLFLRIRAHKIQNGRFDTDVYVMDESGDLVALSRHVSLHVEPRVKPPTAVGEAKGKL